MVTYDLTCTIQEPVSAAQAYEAIASVGEWWAKDFKGSARNVNDTFTVRFGTTFVDFKITEAVPGKRSVWHVVNSSIPSLKDTTEWNGTSVVWEIAENAGTTTITLTHEGITPEVECFKMCEGGWNRHVTQSLRKLLIEEKGTPS
jgi:Activator of Hsp90 ATPase homolog 1-like protein